MKLQVGQFTHSGAQRPVNQDSLGISQGVPPGLLARKGQLFVVADGFGKEPAGNTASTTAVRALTKAYYASRERDTGTALVRAVQQANQAVAQALAAAGPSGAGTTLTVAVVRGPNLHVAHVGDSRAYLLRAGQLRQITHDHTWGAEQVRSGKLKPEQVAQDPKRGQLSRALGIQPTLPKEAIQHVAETLQTGDTLLLCTDGLTDQVRDSEIAPILAGHDPGAVAQQLVELSRQRGGPDDVTTVVVQVEPKAAIVNLWAPLAAIGGALVLILLAVLLYPKPPLPPPTATGQAWTPPAGTLQPVTPGTTTPQLTTSGTPPTQPATPGTTLTQAATTETPGAPQGTTRATSTVAPPGSMVTPSPQAPPSGTGTPTAPATQIVYSAPQLVGPPENAEFRGPDAAIRLQWNSVGTLGADDYYVVISDFAHDGATWHDWQHTKETELVVPRYLYDQLGSDRRVRWRVIVWRKPHQIADGRWEGQSVGTESAVWTYVWAVPPEGPLPSPTPTYGG